MKQGIEVSRTNSDLKLLKASDYFGDAPCEKTIPAGSFVVDTAQPYGRMATALLETETPEDSDFLKRQEALRKANETRGSEEAKQDYEFYDVTAWSLPLAMGVEAYSTDEPLRADITAVPPTSANITVHTPKRGQAENSALNNLERGVAYAFESTSIRAMRLAIQLLRQGYHIETSNEGFRTGEKRYAPW